jgi:hypothetical protein
MRGPFVIVTSPLRIIVLVVVPRFGDQLKLRQMPGPIFSRRR